MESKELPRAEAAEDRASSYPLWPLPCFIYKMWLTLSCLSEGKAHTDDLLRSLLEPLEICDFTGLILILLSDSRCLFLSPRPRAPHLQKEKFRGGRTSFLFLAKWNQNEHPCSPHAKPHFSMKTARGIGAEIPSVRMRRPCSPERRGNWFKVRQATRGRDANRDSIIALLGFLAAVPQERKHLERGGFTS